MGIQAFFVMPVNRGITPPKVSRRTLTVFSGSACAGLWPCHPATIAR